MIKSVRKVGNNFVINENMTVPNNKDNGHFEMIEKWVKDGGVIDESVDDIAKIDDIYKDEINTDIKFKCFIKIS